MAWNGQPEVTFAPQCYREMKALPIVAHATIE
jgi:hypothetical protein